MYLMRFSLASMMESSCMMRILAVVSSQLPILILFSAAKSSKKFLKSRWVPAYKNRRIFSGGTSRGASSVRTCLISERLVPKPPVVMARFTASPWRVARSVWLVAEIRGSIGGPVTITRLSAMEIFRSLAISRKCC